VVEKEKVAETRKTPWDMKKKIFRKRRGWGGAKTTGTKGAYEGGVIVVRKIQRGKAGVHAKEEENKMQRRTKTTRRVKIQKEMKKRKSRDVGKQVFPNTTGRAMISNPTDTLARFRAQI